MKLNDGIVSEFVGGHHTANARLRRHSLVLLHSQHEGFTVRELVDGCSECGTSMWNRIFKHVYGMSNIFLLLGRRQSSVYVLLSGLHYAGTLRNVG